MEEGAKDINLIGLLGEKSLNLLEMTCLGIPVPSGFIITKHGCKSLLVCDKNNVNDIWRDVTDAIQHLERITGKNFGNQNNPLLVSCRFGGKCINPGAMEAVLNIGCNDQVVESLLQNADSVNFAYETYRRLIQGLGCNALEIPEVYFENAIETARKKAKSQSNCELNIKEWKELIIEFKRIFYNFGKTKFPEDAFDQIKLAIEGVFINWNKKYAFDYRNAANIKNDFGVSIIIMEMTFSNRSVHCAAGFALTRDASSGKKGLNGNYWINSYNDETINNENEISSLAIQFPEANKKLTITAKKLEKYYHDLYEIEFVIENDFLWVLQSRTAWRTAYAAIRVAVDMSEENLISHEQALLRILPEQVESLLHNRFQPEAAIASKSSGNELATGLNVSPGVAYGKVIFGSKTAEELVTSSKEKMILVLPETKPEDVPGILAADGILTNKGGRTSHAALVARQLGKPAVVIANIEMDLDQRQMIIGNVLVKENDFISIDGSSGKIYLGKIEIQNSFANDQWLNKLLSWADDFARMRVWANIDSAKDALLAKKNGAVGIGLFRTEHMLLLPNQLSLFQNIILSEIAVERKKWLQRLQIHQEKEFTKIFRILNGMPIVFRLLDPPLHEFLPNLIEMIEELSDLKLQIQKYQKQEVKLECIKSKIKENEKVINLLKKMTEKNPMLGFRGVRLGIKMPEIVKMQVNAIFKSACRIVKEGGRVTIGIMIPMVIHFNEIKNQRRLVEKVASEVMTEYGVRLDYKFGSMIETPRAALTADEIARYADFFSFGTNDLTQTTCAVSRDDAELAFFPIYMQKKIFNENPFMSVDENGVGRMIKNAIKEASSVNPDLIFSVCGEHAGNPRSIDFYNRIGVDYVSCSPLKIPVARLASAHATLAMKCICN